MTTTIDPTSPLRRGALMLLKALAGRREGLPLLRSEELRRVLLIRYDRLGDMVITTPIIEALRSIAPGVEIDLLASHANRTLLDGDPRVREVFVWDGSLLDRLRVIRACRSRRYDASFQLILGRTTLPAILTGILTPHGRTIGKKVPRHEFLFDHPVVVDEGHFSEKTFALLRGGIARCEKMEQPHYTIHIGEERERKAMAVIERSGLRPGEIAMLNISAGSPIRELSHERYVELARRLAGLGVSVGVFGAPDAWERVERIARDAGGAPLRFGSLLEAVAGMGMARIIITPDTAITHIAAAVHVPVVVMFPAFGDPSGWSPYGVPYRVVKARSGSTLETIDISAVVEAAGEMLNYKC